MSSTPAPSLGFSQDTTGTHMSRTMMLKELTTVIRGTSPTATLEDIRQAIVEENLAAKPTASSRVWTFRHLERLYGLDKKMLLYRTFRQYVKQEPDALPLLAVVLAYARDTQLRTSFELIRVLKPVEQVSKARMVEYLKEIYPDRYSEVVIQGLAKHVLSTWTTTGHLVGRDPRKRYKPQPHWIATTYSMLTGYLTGLRGQDLMSSVYAELVGVDPSTAAEHLAVASAHGLMRFRNAGGVVEMDFSSLLEPHERALIFDDAH